MKYSISKLVLMVFLTTFCSSLVHAQTVPQKSGASQFKILKHKRPIGPGKFSVGPSKPRGHEYKHDSDKQLDIWVSRCNKAGGGMELGDDGNYRCVGTDGKDIDNW